MENKPITPADMEPEKYPLDRIADALENISQTLEYLNDTLGCINLQLGDITELTECISNTPRGKLFCIGHDMNL